MVTAWAQWGPSVPGSPGRVSGEGESESCERTVRTHGDGSVLDRTGPSPLSGARRGDRGAAVSRGAGEVVAAVGWVRSAATAALAGCSGLAAAAAAGAAAAGAEQRQLAHCLG